MTEETLYPEYIAPIDDKNITPEEEAELASKLILGHEAGDVSDWKNLVSRALYALANANIAIIPNDRKKEIHSKLWQVENIDKNLFQQKKQLMQEVDTIMTTWPQPTSKTALNNALQGIYYLNKNKMYDKYSRYRCKKTATDTAPTFAEFASTYPTLIEPPPPPPPEEP
jgi:hypothetical protein